MGRDSCKEEGTAVNEVGEGGGGIGGVVGGRLGKRVGSEVKQGRGWHIDCIVQYISKYTMTENKLHANLNLFSIPHICIRFMAMYCTD